MINGTSDRYRTPKMSAFFVRVNTKIHYRQGIWNTSALQFRLLICKLFVFLLWRITHIFDIQNKSVVPFINFMSLSYFFIITSCTRFYTFLYYFWSIYASSYVIKRNDNKTTGISHTYQFKNSRNYIIFIFHFH